MRRTILATGFVVWAAVWLCVFSLAQIDSFFAYNLGVRLPFLFLALLAVATPPLAAAVILGRVRKGLSGTRSAIVYLLVTTVPIVLYWSIFAVWGLLAGGPGRVAFEADEAMGIGINFAICAAVWIISNLAFCLATLFDYTLRRRSFPSGDDRT